MDTVATLPPPTPRPRGFDVPDFVPPGTELGRTVNLQEALRRFGEPEVKVITEDYNTGDEIGYQLFAELQQLPGPRGQGKQLFEQAIEHGIDSLENPPAALVEFFRQTDAVPSWVDWDQLRRGSIAYWRAGQIVVMALAYAAIGAGFRTYGGSRPLVMSRRLIERDQVGRRMVETLRWAASSTAPDGMRRDGDGYRLTMKVRWIHMAVRYFLSRDPNWKWRDWGMVVSNTDSVYTMGCLFSEGVIHALQKVGIKLSSREVDDIVALWRYIGHVMGIPEEANFSSWQDLNRKSQIIKLIEHPADEGCRMLMTSLTDYMCTEKIEGFDIIPPIIGDRLTVEQKKRLTHGLMRAWAGDEICDQLAVPNSKLRYLLPAARPFVSVREHLSRLFGNNDEATALRALASFGVVTKLKDGETEVADADDVIRGMKKFGGRTHEILGRH